MSLSELSSEYWTINGWIKDVKEVKELKKEMARIKEENEI